MSVSAVVPEKLRGNKKCDQEEEKEEEKEKQHTFGFLPRDAMHRCSTKTAKHRITQTTPHDTPGTPVF